MLHLNVEQLRLRCSPMNSRLTLVVYETSVIARLHPSFTKGEVASGMQTDAGS